MEERASYTDDLVAQAFANSTEPQPGAALLAVVESCTSLIAGPLAVASVSGYDLPGQTLLAMGRDLLLRGNSVWLIDVLPNGQVQLLRASSFEVAGRSSIPSRWSYSLAFETPNGQTIERTAPSTGIVHVMGDTPQVGVGEGTPPGLQLG